MFLYLRTGICKVEKKNLLRCLFLTKIIISKKQFEQCRIIDVRKKSQLFFIRYKNFKVLLLVKDSSTHACKYTQYLLK